ncbi:copper chaperone PCu(A)C [Rhodoferax sp. U2-2l]|uniref:copper chaperone PCu(A)C n=1 Tax=Rhodoferax sp. U2-2l TaxID=2884000 RepID=UPI001D09A0F2|nr:copper chaperone PCu(A)C [Rhodoferax sp. U2-2l]MCB8746752.1 copper chaperone PCu(A)C [Rhodoferax sp. U2-2l]
MKKLTLSLCLLAAATLAQAQVTIHAPWVRGTVPMQQASGAFMQLSADKSTRLVAAQSPVAKVVEIHEMVMDNNVMKMRQVPGLDIVPGSTLDLKPGGFHIMLIELKQQLKGGDVVPITLVFEDTQTKKQFTQEVQAPVTALGGGNMPMKH